MKLLKKTNKEQGIITQPKKNGLKNETNLVTKKKKQNRTPSTTSSRTSSQRSRTSSRSSVRSGSDADRSVDENSGFDDGSNFSDSYFSETDDDDEFGRESVGSQNDVEKQKKRPKKKKNPIVNSCCGFCSLGAGSLITGIFYICLGIGFMVYRVNDYRVKNGKSEVIYTGTDLYKDIWKIILIAGMCVIGISMLGALVLVVSSCVFGQKENFRKMRAAVIVWCCLTGLAVLWNIGEGVYVILIPATYDVSVAGLGLSEPFSSKEIKALLPTIWTLTGIYSLFYIYLVLVLISYLRLLKYQDAPKVGGKDMAEEIKNISRPGSGINRSTTLRPRPGRESLERSVSSNNLQQSGEGTPPQRTDEDQFQNLEATNTNVFRDKENTYINWPATVDETVPDEPAESNDKDDKETLPVPSVYDVPLKQSANDSETSIKNIVEQTMTTKLLPEAKHDSQGHVDTQLSAENKEMKLEKPVVSSTLPNHSKYTFDRSLEDKANQSVDAESTYSEPSSQPIEAPPSGLVDNQKVSKQDQFIVKPKKEVKKVEPTVVSNFFRKLSQDSIAHNPMEEMFRLFGGDLCNQHPENSERYLKSYKDVHSKSSHLNVIKDPFDNESLLTRSSINEGASTLPHQFPLGNDDYSVYNSFYSRPSMQFHNPPSRHISHLSHGPEPVYDYRPRSRDDHSSFHWKQVSRTQTTSNDMTRRRDRPLLDYRRDLNYHPSSIYSSYSATYDPYYDDSCSTCYGDYIYGDYSEYGDCYSFNGYYPQQGRRHQTLHAYPVCDPIPPKKNFSYQPSSSSTLFNINRGKSNRTISNATWIPIESNNDFTGDHDSESYFFTDRSRSLPNLADKELDRTMSYESENTHFSNPLSPEFTLPSPRETRKLSRLSSRSNSRRQSLPRSSSFNARSSYQASLNSHRNYSGYHTGDLRSRTSHTSEFEKNAWNRSSSLQNRNASRLSSRISRQSSSSRNWHGNYHERNREFSVSSRNQGSSRSNTLPRMRSSDNFFDSPSRLSRPRNDISRVSSRQISKNYDPYPDKHVQASPSNDFRYNRNLSQGGSRALIPYNRISEQKGRNLLQRTRSVRYNCDEPRTISKQVKFGSTPDLRRF